MREPVKIGMVSLGCSKNRVDAELMLQALQKSGYAFTENPGKADVILVNTCGFIESAKQESVDAILEYAQYKKTGQLKALVVTGCLSKRYSEELAKELPEVDAFLGVTAWDSVVKTVKEVLQGKQVLEIGPIQIDGDYGRRVLTTPPHYAYVKIAEGCNNCCAYCAIPAIRGKYQSRDISSIVEEVSALVDRGVKEINLIAQDTTRYGQDLYGGYKIAELVDKIASQTGAAWVRLLYCYPEAMTDALLDVMTKHSNVLRYLDIPMQHFDDAILKRMNRRNTCEEAYRLVEKIRRYDPSFVLRTTLITGFPGETEREFETLKRGVEDLQFDHLGVFAYSREDGTKAADMQNQVPDAVKQQRMHEVMELQQQITYARNQKYLGDVQTALMEGCLDGRYMARTYMQAPDIDGVVWVDSKVPLTVGTFYNVRITRAEAYDLYGEVVL